MRKYVICILVVSIVFSSICLAFAQQKTQEEMKRDVLIANLTALRNEELRVAVLQQLIDQENAQLTRMQAIFSDQYSLDPNKLRAGMYIYDDKAGKFVEREIPKEAKEEKAGAPAADTGAKSR